ncbi:hypothetical protein GCM10027411_11470 [Microbacterium aureliae]
MRTARRAAAVAIATPSATASAVLPIRPHLRVRDYRSRALQTDRGGGPNTPATRQHRLTPQEDIMSSSPNRLVATIFGAVYLLVGLLGFTATAGVGFIAADGGLLLGIFEVNPLHNIAHLLIGAALLVAGLSRVAAAKGVNTTVGAVYLLLGVVGFFLVGTPLNILALNTPDHFLHLASALVLLGVGLGADRTVRSRAAV